MLVLVAAVVRCLLQILIWSPWYICHGMSESSKNTQENTTTILFRSYRIGVVAVLDFPFFTTASVLLFLPALI